MTALDLKRMEIRKVFEAEKISRVNSLDFSRDGELLLASTDDGTLELYNALDATAQGRYFCKTNGIANTLFTHHKTAVIGSTSLNKFDHSIQYLSIHDNAYLRAYRGHTDRINCLALSPVDDIFISTSLDSSLRIWDLNAPQCQGILNAKEGHHVAAIDIGAAVFCVLSTGNTGRFYDFRKYSQGPFSTFTVEHEAVTWASLEFSNDGRFMLANAHQGVAFLLDAMKGQMIQKITTVENKNKCSLGACFTPDSRCVMLGSENKHVHVFEVPESASEPSEAREVTWLKGHSGPVGCVRFNPQYNMFASACTLTALWQPSQTQ